MKKKNRRKNMFLFQERKHGDRIIHTYQYNTHRVEIQYDKYGREVSVCIKDWFPYGDFTKPYAVRGETYAYDVIGNLCRQREWFHRKGMKGRNHMETRYCYDSQQRLCQIERKYMEGGKAVYVEAFPCENTHGFRGSWRKAETVSGIETWEFLLPDGQLSYVVQKEKAEDGTIIEKEYSPMKGEFPWAFLGYELAFYERNGVNMEYVIFEIQVLAPIFTMAMFQEVFNFAKKKTEKEITLHISGRCYCMPFIEGEKIDQFVKSREDVSYEFVT